MRTLLSFVPKDQDEKLAIIDDANFFLQNTLNPDQIDPEPTPAETLEAINKTAADLSGAAGSLDSPAAMQARRLASLLTALAKAPPAARDEAQRVLVTPLKTTLRQVRRPPDRRAGDDRHASALAQKRLGLGGRSSQDRGRAERGRKRQRRLAPLRQLRSARWRLRPAGTPIFIVEAAATIVKAFLQAAVWSLVSIALILFVALRRWTGCRADAGASAGCHRRHARNLRGDRTTAEFRQHHRTAASCSAWASRSKSTTSWRGGRGRRTFCNRA